MKKHPDCAKVCQYAEEAGCWPEYQCSGECQWLMRSDGPPEEEPPMKTNAEMKWKYHRIGTSSKWVLGNNWVTKFDGDRVCVLGINGKRSEGLLTNSPKIAREHIESLIAAQTKPDAARRGAEGPRITP
jgi:hypothetical protein